MANTINDYFENAQLSQAAYASLDTSMNTNFNAYTSALRFDNNFTESQAEQFANTYSIVDQSPDTGFLGSGFSGTVFKRNSDGKLFFTMRGTEVSVSDIFGDVAVGVYGAAAWQIVDMYNYYQRLIASTGADVIQYKLGNYNIDTAQFEFSTYTETGAGLGKLDAAQSLTLSGHSLGGHLATAFTYLFPTITDSTYGYNSFGIETNTTTENLFYTLGSTLIQSVDAKVTHVYAEPGPEWAASYYPLPGQDLPIYIEDQMTSVGNHSIKYSTDALAVYNLLYTLDDTLTIEKVTPYLKQISNKPENSLEGVVNVIGDLFQYTTTDATVGNRDSLYSTIAGINTQIETTPSYEAMQGLYSVVPTLGLSGSATSTDGAGLAYRYSLLNLIPFAVTGDLSLYSPFSDAISLYNESTQTGVMTPEYMTDKEYMLTVLMARNAVDASLSLPDVATPVYFKDYETGTEVTNIATLNYPQDPRIKTIFGDGDDNVIDGGNHGDRLYGGDGSDILRGTQFNNDDGVGDYFEGGSGDDTYLIGANDVVMDADGIGRLIYKTETGKQYVLNGGTFDGTAYISDDKLFTYILSGTTLTIQKQGVTGSVTVNNYHNLELGIHLDDNTRTDQQLPGNFGYTIYGDFEALDTDSSIAGVQVGYDWVGNYIRDTSQPTILNDVLFGSSLNDAFYTGSGNDQVNYNIFGGSFGGNDYAEMGLGDDEFTGGNGNDWADMGDGFDIFSGGNGNDYAEGGEGNDLLNGYKIFGVPEYETESNNDVLLGGGGKDVLNGQGGDDILEGGSGNDVIEGDDFYTLIQGNDRMFATTESDMALMMDPDSLLTSTDRDWLNGRSGDDLLVGGAGADALFGGGGKDQIIAGPGDDYIYGDVDAYLRMVYPFDIENTDINWELVEENDSSYTFYAISYNDSTGSHDRYAVSDAVSMNGEQLTIVDPDDSDADTVYGGNGNDRIWGGDGDDVLLGETGEDELTGEAGSDYLFGGVGRDVIHGDNAASILDVGQHGDDFIDGGDGDDILYGDGGNDILIGGEGLDIIYGDRELTVTGNDILDGGTENDSLVGGMGDDTYIFGYGYGVDTIDEDGGLNDTILLKDVRSTDVMLTGTNGIIDLALKQSGVKTGDVLNFDSGIEHVQFADGEQWDFDKVLSKITHYKITETASFAGNINDNTYKIDASITDGFSIDINASGGFDTLDLSGEPVYLAGESTPFSYTQNTIQSAVRDGDDLVLDISVDKIINAQTAHGQIRLVNQFTEQGNIDEVLSSKFPFGMIVSHEIASVIGGEYIKTSDTGEGYYAYSPNTYYASQKGLVYFGTSGDDPYIQDINSTLPSILDGKGGDDTLTGNNKDDLLIGGAGNDTLVGGLGDDTYEINPLDFDVIVDYGLDEANSSDSLMLPDGVNPFDLTFVRLADDLLIDNLTIQNYFYEDTATTVPSAIHPYKIENIQSNFGSSINIDTLLTWNGLYNTITSTALLDERLDGTDEHDLIIANGNEGVISAGDGHDAIRGSVNSDNIHGDNGDDILHGGKGDDSLRGRDGSDIYIFNRGDGHDTVHDMGSDHGAKDILYLIDILPEEILVSVDTYSMKLSLAGTEDSVTIREWFDTYYNNKIESIVFADGTSWTDTNSNPENILSHVNLYTATENGDYLFGGDENNRVYGLNGNDLLRGGDGDDILFGSAGNDSIKGGVGNDIIAGGAGRDTYIDIGLGDDIYLFNPDFADGIMFGGADENIGEYGYVSETENFVADKDTISFGGGITPETINAYVDYSAGDNGTYNFGLVLSLQSTVNKISVGRYSVSYNIDSGYTYTDSRIENIQFLGTENDRIFDLSALVKARFSELTEATEAAPITLFTVDALQTFDITQTSGLVGGDIAYQYAIGNIQPFTAYHYIYGTITDDTNLIGTLDNDALYGLTGNDTLDGSAGSDQYFGGSGNDVLGSKIGDDFSSHTNRDNLLFGNEYYGGTGQDLLNGSQNADIYFYNSGDGFDIIDEADGITGDAYVDTIKLGEGIAPSDVTLTRENTTTDLLINFSNSTDQIRISQWYANDNNRVEKIEFAEGEVWDVVMIHDAGLEVHGSVGSDTLTGLDNQDDHLFGGDGDDTLNGGYGVDHLFGGSGIDTLGSKTGTDFTNSRWDATTGLNLGNEYTGGTGDDILNGSRGADTYYFSVGDGMDSIDEMDGMSGDTYTDSIILGTDIYETDIDNITRINSDLLINFTNGTDQIRINQWYAHDDNRVEQLKFSNENIVWDVTAMHNYGLIVNGTDNVEVLFGLDNQDDKLFGHGGGDLLIGYGGNDHLSGGAGGDYMLGYSGNDVLDGGEGSNYLHGGDGFDVLYSSQLTAAKDYYYGEAGNDIIIASYGDDLLDGGTGEDTLMGNVFGDNTYIFAAGYEKDTIFEGGTDDTDQVNVFVDPLSLIFERTANNLDMRIAGTDDTLTVSNWYSSDNNKVNTFYSSDGSILLDTQIDQLIQAMATFCSDNGSISWEQAIQEQSTNVLDKISAYWQPST